MTTALDVEQGWRAFRAAAPDALVLDVMLPGQDGFSLLRRVREQGRCPVIMLTARGDVADRVMGLELGADDYLPKPFDPRELVARVQAVLRRARGYAPLPVLGKLVGYAEPLPPGQQPGFKIRGIKTWDWTPEMDGLQA